MQQIFIAGRLASLPKWVMEKKQSKKEDGAYLVSGTSKKGRPYFKIAFTVIDYEIVGGERKARYHKCEKYHNTEEEALKQLQHMKANMGIAVSCDNMYAGIWKPNEGEPKATITYRVYHIGFLDSVDGEYEETTAEAVSSEAAQISGNEDDLPF